MTPAWITYVAGGVGALVLAALLVLVFIADDADDVRDRSQRASKTVFAGFGMGLAGVAGILLGAVEGVGVGLSSVGAGIGSFLLSHLPFISDLALLGLGWAGTVGRIMITGAGFLILGSAVILVGLMLAEAN